MGADLSGLDLLAFMVDGVHFADHVCIVALGITIDGVKVPLAIEECSTENATLVTSLTRLQGGQASGRHRRSHDPPSRRRYGERPRISHGVADTDATWHSCKCH